MVQSCWEQVLSIEGYLEGMWGFFQARIITVTQQASYLSLNTGLT